MISKDFFAALDMMAGERNISRDVIIKDMEEALSIAFRKMQGEAKSARVELNFDKKSIEAYSYVTVVADEDDNPDKEFDWDKEIRLSEAHEINKKYKIGDVIETKENLKDFGRVAAITIKQVMTGKTRERARAHALEEITARQDQIITAKVTKIDSDITHLEIPGSTLGGVLNSRNTIPGQHFKVGDFLKVYIPKISNDDTRGEIYVTRTSPQFVRALFDLEVPEIASGEVQIKSIAREAGYRTKICVHSEIANIDPIGACVGAKGSRINNILAEIQNEKIDIIPWSDDPLEFIASSLSPAPVLRVEANEVDRVARVIVPNDKLSLAIGKSGMNVRLAAKLTGWRIDVKSEERAAEEDASFTEEYKFGQDN
ncbi:MAG: transcription termination factor NusA [Christensenellaceae bacterium]|jgi:N utilization substance protein A|nr:transcription termination factor NusA [Christensenellaceae bacterium]